MHVYERDEMIDRNPLKILGVLNDLKKKLLNVNNMIKEVKT